MSVRDFQNYKTRYVTSTGSAWVLKIDQLYPSDVAEGSRGELVHFHVSQMQHLPYKFLVKFVDLTIHFYYVVTRT